MKRNNLSMRTSDRKMTEKKVLDVRIRILIIALLFVGAFLLSAMPADAAVGDSFRAGWDRARPFVTSGKYWVNALVLFGVMVIFYITLLAKEQTATSKQVMIYIALVMFALIFAVKFVGASGDPIWMWENESVQGMIKFTLGPSEPGTGDCAGPGAYIKTVGGEPQCKQAILKTNTDGRGLPAFIAAAILFTLLFMKYKTQFGMDKMGQHAGKWFPVFMGVLLGAMAANDGVQKDTALMVGGWVAVVLIGNSLAKNFGQDTDKKGGKKGFGFGMAYAFVELILNILGSSLIGMPPEGGAIGFYTVLKNIAIGFVVGYIFSIASGRGVFGRVKERLDRKLENSLVSLFSAKLWLNLARFMRDKLPYIKNIQWLKKNPALQKNKRRIQDIELRLARWEKSYDDELAKEGYKNEAFLNRCDSMVSQLKDELDQARAEESEIINRIKTGEIDDQGKPVAHSTGGQEPPAPNTPVSASGARNTSAEKTRGEERRETPPPPVQGLPRDTTHPREQGSPTITPPQHMIDTPPIHELPAERLPRPVADTGHTETWDPDMGLTPDQGTGGNRPR